MQECMLGKLDHLYELISSFQLQAKGKGPAESDSILGKPPGSLVEEGSYARTQYTNMNRQIGDPQSLQAITPLPKIDFPRFDGTQPRVWILKCNSYFKMIPNIPEEQRIALATMNFEEKAALWYQSYSTKLVNLTWNQFVDVVAARFEDLKETNIVVEFNKLRHTGSYVEYVERFEELKECMTLYDNNAYSETYFVASFLSGLSEELRAAVKMFNPSSLEQAIELRQNQLVSIEALTRKLKGEDGITTLRFTGNSQGHPLQILIDTGSTLSFIKESTAQLIGCTTTTATPLLILVANGQRLVSTSHAEEFGWEVQGHKLTHSLRLLQHEGCDVILGGDWLKACTPIELDYKKMAVTINCGGKKFQIFANKSTADCSLISHHSLYKLLHTKARVEVEEIFVVTSQKSDYSESS
ncbi:hypothetical protein C2S51_018029 [Perilla frutescens var. frutescens]|nr:hypothetical protein C2S51_018029 [Perilla frutescens var. frutescens]